MSTTCPTCGAEVRTVATLGGSRRVTVAHYDTRDKPARACSGGWRLVSLSGAILDEVTS